jgi:hypothetical protein
MTRSSRSCFVTSTSETRLQLRDRVLCGVIETTLSVARRGLDGLRIDSLIADRHERRDPLGYGAIRFDISPIVLERALRRPLDTPLDDPGHEIRPKHAAAWPRRLSSTLPGHPRCVSPGGPLGESCDTEEQRVEQLTAGSRRPGSVAASTRRIGLGSHGAGCPPGGCTNWLRAPEMPATSRSSLDGRAAAATLPVDVSAVTLPS